MGNKNNNMHNTSQHCFLYCISRCSLSIKIRTRDSREVSNYLFCRGECLLNTVVYSSRKCTCLALQLDKLSIEKQDSKLSANDKELDGLKVERRCSKKRTASAREEAKVFVEDVERLEQEKQLLMEEIRKKESEVECFNKLYTQSLSISQREKEVLQGSIESKENELRDAKAKLGEKEEQLKKCKEKIGKLKKKIEEGVRELGVRDGRIIELEKDKAKATAELESERMKVRIHSLMVK